MKPCTGRRWVIEDCTFPWFKNFLRHSISSLSTLCLFCCQLCHYFGGKQWQNCPVRRRIANSLELLPCTLLKSADLFYAYSYIRWKNQAHSITRLCHRQPTKKTYFELIALYVHPKNLNHLRSHLRAIIALDHSRGGLENKSGRIFLCSTSLLFKVFPTNLGVCQNQQPSIDHDIDVQSVFSWAPKVARKCESKNIGMSVVRTDGRRRCTVTWLPIFYVMTRFTFPWRAFRALESSAITFDNLFRHASWNS